MKTKPFQTFLKVWITVASLAAFFFGWIVLGHSGKPATSFGTAVTSNTSDPTTQLAPLPTLAPLTSLGSSTGLQSLPQVQSQAQQPSFNFTPRFRTRGS